MNRLHSGISVLVPESLPSGGSAWPFARPRSGGPPRKPVRILPSLSHPVWSRWQPIFSNTASTPALWLAEFRSSELFRYPAGTDNAVSGLLVNLLWPPWHIVDSTSVCQVKYCGRDGCPRVPVAGRRIGSVRPQTRGRGRSRGRGRLSVRRYDDVNLKGVLLAPKTCFPNMKWVSFSNTVYEVTGRQAPARTRWPALASSPGPRPRLLRTLHRLVVRELSRASDRIPLGP